MLLGASLATLYRMSLFIITVKTPFLSSLLISLYYKSIKGVSYTKTNISISGSCFTDCHGTEAVANIGVLGWINYRSEGVV